MKEDLEVIEVVRQVVNLLSDIYLAYHLSSFCNTTLRTSLLNAVETVIKTYPASSSNLA